MPYHGRSYQVWEKESLLVESLVLWLMSSTSWFLSVADIMVGSLKSLAAGVGVELTGRELARELSG